MSLVQKARTLAIDLVVHRTAHDTHCQLDASVVPALRAHSILDALLPEELGGHQLAPHIYVELLEALAQGDSATAWCTMTASTTMLLAAYLPRPAAEAMFGDKRSPFCAGIFAPTGALVADGAGFRLTGKWSYASGCRHAEWFAVGAMHETRHVICFVPRTAIRIIDNWDVLGLRGTGSHDIAIDAAEVSPAHVTSVFTEQPWAAGALYRLPLFGLLAVGVAGCALGIAREALVQANKRLANDTPAPVLQHHAELHARLAAARAYALSECQQAYARAGLGSADVPTRGALRLAASHVSRECLAVVRGAFDAAGGAAARSHHPVGNALCDLQVLTTHRMVQPRIWPASMRALHGLDGVPPEL